MKASDEFLPDLKVAFREWRSTKKHRNEPIPHDLLKQALAAGDKYGSRRVARALMLEPKKLAGDASQTPTPAAPSFSRIQVAFPPAPQSTQALLEVETPVGVKLKVFAMTPETVGVLSALCRGSFV